MANMMYMQAIVFWIYDDRYVCSFNKPLTQVMVDFIIKEAYVNCIIKGTLCKFTAEKSSSSQRCCTKFVVSASFFESCIF